MRSSQTKRQAQSCDDRKSIACFAMIASNVALWLRGVASKFRPTAAAKEVPIKLCSTFVLFMAVPSAG
jgi:hypothetical protein